MAYVFTIRNRVTGAVQIGEKYANLALRQKVTLTSASAETFWGYRAQLVVSSASPPVVAVNSTVLTFLFSVARSGNTWTFTYYTASNAAQITCYIFGEPDVSGLPAGNTLQLKNPATGKVVFDHRLKYARRAGKIEGSGLASGSTTLTTGKTYAAIQCRHAGTYSLDIYENDGGHSGGLNSRDDVRTGLGLRFASNVAWRGELQVFERTMPTNISPEQSFSQWPAYMWLVLDVTGY